MFPLRSSRGVSGVLRTSFRTSQTPGSWRLTPARRYFRIQSHQRAEESKGQEKSEEREDPGRGLLLVGVMIGCFVAGFGFSLFQYYSKLYDLEDRTRPQLRARERYPLLALTLPEAERKLREEEKRTVERAVDETGPIIAGRRHSPFNPESGTMKTVTYENRIASNSPVEDQYSHEVFHARTGVDDPQKSETRRYEAWGVFDGHA